MNYLWDTSMLAYRCLFMDTILCMNILENLYLEDNSSGKCDTLCTIWSDWDVDIDKVSGQNKKLCFYQKTVVLQKNCSRKSISQPNYNLPSYPLRIFLVYNPLLMNKIWDLKLFITSGASVVRYTRFIVYEAGSLTFSR
jgi:hypothetical protein